MSDRKVRVRFAPSPTGALHIGGVRTALYNYLFARQHGGDLIFRIEDTDSNRFVPGAEEYIIESFKWLGIKFDEGVSFGGEHGPYRQSERRDIYKKYVDVLMEAARLTSLSILRKNWMPSVRKWQTSSTMLQLVWACVTRSLSRRKKWMH